MPLWLYFAFLLVNNFIVIFVTRRILTNDIRCNIFLELSKIFTAESESFSKLGNDESDDYIRRAYNHGTARGFLYACNIVIGKYLKEKD